MIKQGKENYHSKAKNQTMNINPVGIRWLNRSAVATLKRVVSLTFLKNSCCRNIEECILFRSLGGRAILLTFSSTEERDGLISHPWMDQWLCEVKPWRGEAASTERFVWLGCYGVPLDAWSVRTFKEIGERWGSCIEVGEETMQETSFAKGRVLIVTNEADKIVEEVRMVIRGREYMVRVVEEETALTPEEVLKTKDGMASFNGVSWYKGEPGKGSQVREGWR